MKLKISIPYIASFGASLFFAISPQTSAADGTWGTGSGSGNWGDEEKWAGQVIADGQGAIAIFPLSDAAVKPDITILDGEVFTVGTLRSNAVPSARLYTIKGAGTLNFDNGENPAEILLGTGTAGINLVMEANVSGTGGLLIQGSNSATQLNWDPLTMGITGGIRIEGAGLHIFDGAKLGNNTITLASRMVSGTEHHSFIGIEQATATTVNIANNLVLASSGSGFKYSISGSTTFRTINVSGVISESGGSRQMNYVTDTGAGNGRFVVSGNNTYTGDTVIGGPSTGGVVVRATSNGAFGAGDANVSFSSAKTAVELAGDVTISDKTITLNGLGYGDAGSLRSVSGQNSWAGDVVLGATGENRIQVDAGKLEIEGEISGGNILSKTGSGVLELAEANVHTGETQVRGGTLLLSHDRALETSALSLAAGTKLEVGAGIAATATGLTLANGAELIFTPGEPNALGEALLTITGDQVNSGGSGNLYEITILGSGLVANESYLLLLIEGGAAATLDSFHLNIGEEYMGSTLTWSDGQLQLQVIPEASTVWLSLLGGMALLMVARQRIKVA